MADNETKRCNQCSLYPCPTWRKVNAFTSDLADTDIAPATFKIDSWEVCQKVKAAVAATVESIMDEHCGCWRVK